MSSQEKNADLLQTLEGKIGPLRDPSDPPSSAREDSCPCPFKGAAQAKFAARQPRQALALATHATPAATYVSSKYKLERIFLTFSFSDKKNASKPIFWKIHNNFRREVSGRFEILGDFDHYRKK